jgi:LDH2 family malate/lactate/ureidoglycolate dehydrogenase
LITTPEVLHGFIRAVLLAAGADERSADDVAEHLVSANMSGVDTHGVWQLPGYVTAIRAGDIVPAAEPGIVRESPTSALISGHWGFGHVAAKLGMRLAIEKARVHEVAIVSVVQVTHIGRLGYYTEMAAEAGMISMVWGGGYGVEAPAAVPWGGSKPVLHTNPLSVGFPTGTGAPVMFDFATTAVAGSKVDVARRKGSSVPANSIVDRQGQPTTRPEDFFDGGALLPFGGHKGYAIMMAVEYLGRIFSGADSYADPDRGGPVMRHQGVTMIVFRADLFQPMSDYLAAADAMAARTRAVPPTHGFSEVLMPGDLEARTRILRDQEGIALDDDFWQTLVELAASLGVEVRP